MTEKDHLNRPILKLNSFKNKTDEPIDSPNTLSLAMDNKIDKAAGDKFNEEIKPEPKNNDNAQSTKKIIPSQQNKKRFYWLKKNIRKYLHICKAFS